MKSILFIQTSLVLLLSMGQGIISLKDDDPETTSFLKSTKRKSIIDSEDKVCTPRKECSANRARISPKIQQTMAFTDSLNEIIQREPIPFDEELSEIPPDIDKFAPNVTENLIYKSLPLKDDENEFILSMNTECTQDKMDYCRGRNFKSSNHTMCKYCGLGPKCPYYLNPDKNDVTGRAIQDNDTIDYILDLHNEIRSKITKGRCNQPKGGCMSPLKWDPELARVAQKWADQCTEVDYKEDVKRKDPLLYHDKHGNRKIDRFSNWQGTGQNVARDISKGRAGTFNAHKLIGHWFNQILYFDPIGVQSFGSGNQCSQGIGYYTQLVWQDTTHVGCGWVQFQYRGFDQYFENFLVCNYGPSANIWKQPVYDVAEDVCSCPCIGCDKDTGLCPTDSKYALWTGWESWSSCSASCGGGTRQRQRRCEERDTFKRPSLAKFRVPPSTLLLRNNRSRLNELSPRKNVDLSLCKPGIPEETGRCAEVKCPEWSSWGKWSSCSVSCGGGKMTRSRNCRALSSSFLGVNVTCTGPPTEIKTCNAEKCPDLSNWSAWTECSKKCGSGERYRERTCGGEIYPNTQNPCQASLYERELCNTQLCPSYTEWSEWSACSATCGGGVQERNRVCVQPSFRRGPQLDCKGGPPTERRACKEKTCPKWGSWSEWGLCSVTCGGGKRLRNRECQIEETSTTPNSCPGNGVEEESCNTNRCPQLGPWSDWSGCSATCGPSGTRQRGRDCGLTREGDLNPCKAPLRESEGCNVSECPVYGSWSEWGVCSVTCGGGLQNRERNCKGDFCEGTTVETRRCNGYSCPVWTQWSSWTECSTSCGGGKRQKVRECLLPSGQRSGGLVCSGKGLLSEKCNGNPCPELGPWSDWTECSSSCGGGIQTRTRECGIPLLRKGEDNPCIKPLYEINKCNVQKCPSFTPWSEWSGCSTSCGLGYRKKSRGCKVGGRRDPKQLLFRGNPCGGPLELVQECNIGICPTWSSWGEWSSCTQSCNGGRQKRIRNCNTTTSAQQLCEGKGQEERDCGGDPCPIYNEWSSWTPCSRSCGPGGVRTKVRTCTKDALESCSDKIVREACNTMQICPSWSEWTAWSTCSVSCGGGNQKRIRDCIEGPRGTSFGCDGNNWEIQACNRMKCPTWTDWTQWSVCSVTCGKNGRRNRRRECADDKSELAAVELYCPGRGSQIQACNNGVPKCPFPGEWSEWSSCSKSCGSGSKTRKRECIDSKFRNGNACNADLVDTQTCNDQACPVWSPWTEWTECSRSCGKGMRTKVKNCLDPSTCSGKTKFMEICNEDPCPSLSPWTDWTPCSASCGGGSQRRERDCFLTRSGFLNPCFQELEENRKCNSFDCPKWSNWSDWTPCRGSCGEGTQSRVRACIDLSACDLGETDKEKRACPLSPCPSWSPWSAWSACSVTCGTTGGSKSRQRECKVNNTPSSCDGDATETAECVASPCPTWSDWTEWSECSSSCKPGGQRRKSRRCSSRSKDCLGADSIVEPCNTEVECHPSGWSEWGSWSDCSASCGRGQKIRRRECMRPKGRYGPFQENEEPCDGSGEMTTDCHLGDCPSNSWSPWSECSVTCGGGTRTRSKSCSSSYCHGGSGKDNETDVCNESPCASWSPWGPWGSCSATCGRGTQKRMRSCSLGGPTRLGLLIGPCKGNSEEGRPCSNKRCSDGGSSVLEICKQFRAPNKFGSFSGRPAASTVDCVWDYFSCTKRYGSYPQNKDCCDGRFKLCCEHIMNGGHGSGGSFESITTTEASNSFDPQKDDCSLKLSECSRRGFKSIRQCKLEYTKCTSSLDGIHPSTKRPINDIDIPQLPGFLRPQFTSTIKPIQDLNLPQNQEFVLQNGEKDPFPSLVGQGETQVIRVDEEFMACLLEQFDCLEYCPPLKKCSDLAGLDLSNSDNFVSGSESTSQEFFLPPVNFSLIGSDLLSSAEDKERMFCVREFFACKGPSEDCKLMFKACVDRQESFSVDDLCRGVEGRPENYLVPHPLDCTKFYSCQTLGFGLGYKAHLMDCPFSTGFDRKLKICNFIQSLPRCRRDRGSRRTARLLSGTLAMNERSGAHVGEVGFLTSQIASSSDKTQAQSVGLFLLSFLGNIIFRHS